MGLRMMNVIHPRTRCTTHADLRADGLWEFPDGVAVPEGELESDSSAGCLGMVLLIGWTMMAYKLIIWALGF